MRRRLIAEWWRESPIAWRVEGKRWQFNTLSFMFAHQTNAIRKRHPWLDEGEEATSLLCDSTTFCGYIIHSHNIYYGTEMFTSRTKSLVDDVDARMTKPTSWLHILTVHSTAPQAIRSPVNVPH